MAKLDAEERDSLPDSDFALPGRRYPIHDLDHARAALSRIAQHGSAEEQATVREKVKKRYPDIDVDGKSESEKKPTIAASADTQWGDMGLGNGVHLAVHKATGVVSKDHAKEIPTGSMLTYKDGSGQSESTRRFKVGEHKPHDLGIKPMLRQTSGPPLVNDDAGKSPHLGHIVQDSEHQSCMGYDGDCSISPPSEMLAASAVPQFILRLDDKDITAATVSGLPDTNEAGKKIHYRKVKVAVCRPKAFTHRGTKEEFTITPERAEEWRRNTAALAAAGVKPFIPGQHRDTFNALDNFGYVERVEREGDNVFAVVGLHGDDALDVAAKNGRSVYIVKDAIDQDGKVYPGETLHHLAIVPNPTLSNLGGMMKIAASAEHQAVEIPVYEMTKPPNGAERPKGSPMSLSSDMSRKIRETLSLSADITEDQLPDFLATRTISLSADVIKLTAERDTAVADAKKHSDAVLTLSAEVPKKPDKAATAMYAENIMDAREKTITDGFITEAQAKEVDTLLIGPDGNLSALALSETGPANDRRIFGFRVWKVIRKLMLSADGVATRIGTTRDPNYKMVEVDYLKDKPLNADRYRELGLPVPEGVK